MREMTERDVEYCRSCGHYTGGKAPDTMMCSYFDDTGVLRSNICLPGEGCRVHTSITGVKVGDRNRSREFALKGSLKPKPGAKIDDNRALLLWMDGATDGDLSMQFQVGREAVRRWRAKRDLKENRVK